MEVKKCERGGEDLGDADSEYYPKGGDGRDADRDHFVKGLSTQDINATTDGGSG